MKTIILSITMALTVSTQALAAGVLCSQDSRPVDGVYEDVRLQQKDDGTYDLTTTVIHSGFGATEAPKPETTLLAEGMECNIQEIVAYCFKRGSNSNSRTKISLVGSLEINSLQQRQIERAPEKIKIEVSSPLVKELVKEFSFQLNARFGGCQAI